MSNVECLGGIHLKLNKGYWRPDKYTDLVEPCYNYPANCEGGLETGDASCREGNIGALCEVLNYIEKKIDLLFLYFYAKNKKDMIYSNNLLGINQKYKFCQAFLASSYLN